MISVDPSKTDRLAQYGTSPYENCTTSIPLTVCPCSGNPLFTGRGPGKMVSFPERSHPSSWLQVALSLGSSRVALKARITVLRVIRLSPFQIQRS